jgi:hypothetical protein
MPDRTGSIEKQTVEAENPDCSVLSRMSLAKRGTIGAKSLDGSMQNRTGLEKSLAGSGKKGTLERVFPFVFRLQNDEFQPVGL